MDLPLQRVRATLHALDAADAAAASADLPALLLPWLAEAFCADRAVWTDDGPAGTPNVQPCLRQGTSTLTLCLGGGDGWHACVVLERCGAAFDVADVELAEGLRPLLSRRVLALTQPVAARRTLSSREQEVLDLVATGLTDAAIARRLGCRPRTVDKHLEHAYRALGVGNRAAAVARWMREGNPRT